MDSPASQPDLNGQQDEKPFLTKGKQQDEELSPEIMVALGDVLGAVEELPRRPVKGTRRRSNRKIISDYRNRHYRFKGRVADSQTGIRALRYEGKRTCEEVKETLRVLDRKNGGNPI